MKINLQPKALIRSNIENTINQERISDWQMSRSRFIKSLALLGVASQFSMACSSREEESENKEETITPLMSNRQAKTIIIVQSILFPDDGNGPNVEEINAFPYLLWYLQDELITKQERSFYPRGANLVNQKAQEIVQKDFIDLPLTAQQKIVTILVKDKKTKLWFSKLLTFIFEALLADSYYGGNTNNVGWKWLEHDAGMPRSSAKISYPNILTTVRK